MEGAGPRVDSWTRAIQGRGRRLAHAARRAFISDQLEDLIPRVTCDRVQPMTAAEHAHYGCCGPRATSFFAPASRPGAPEELESLTDKAHGFGFVVLLDLARVARPVRSAALRGGTARTAATRTAGAKAATCGGARVSSAS